MACGWKTGWIKVMGLYSRPSYPEPSYKERTEGKIDVRTYDALIQVLKLRDYSEENPPLKISDQTEARAFTWYMGNGD
jgi:hypothetical protein